MASPSTDRRLGLAGNTAYKVPATVVATANVTQSGEQTIDTVAVKAVNAAGRPDRVLCTAQTNAALNGLWDVNTGQWTRSIDANGNYDLANGTQVIITSGTVNAGLVYRLTTADPITVGTTLQTWTVSPASSLLISLASSIGSSLIGFLQAGTGAVLRTVQSKLRECASAEDFGVVGGGVVDDTATLQAAITNAVAAGFKTLLLTNPAGYKITSTIVQPYSLQVIGIRQLIRCEGITPGAGTPAWRLAYAAWTGNEDRFHFRKPLSNVILRGNAAPADGTYTANLHGVQIEAYHQVIDGVTCVGFDRAFSFAQSSGVYTGWLSWETKFRDCGAFYNKYGLHADFSTAAGASGAGITWTGGALGHNDYTVYNNAGEITFLDAASDAPRLAHVLDNVTMLTGNEIGFMHWQNSRIEAGGQAGTAWITNSGVMRFKDTFFVERNATDAIFNTNAGGYTILEGGTWRTSDGRYKATGNGIVTQRGVRPINDSNGVLLKYENCGILNGDFNDGSTSGFSTTLGTVALTNVADATFLGSGKCMNMVASAFPATVASVQIELDQSQSNFALTFKASNANASGLTVTVRQYNRAGVQVSTATTNIAASSATTPYAIKHRRFPNSAYVTVEIGFVAGQVSQVRASDFYLTQW